MKPTPSSRDPFDFQGAMYAVPWLLTAMSIWAAGARIYVRRKYSRTVDADDWVMLVAVMFQIVYQAIITIDITKGVGKSTAPTSTDDDFVDLLKWAWISSALACLVSVTARLSIAMFLIRAFGSRTWYKWFMVILTSIIAILGVVNIVIIWFQTRPVQALWDFRIHVPRWDPKVQRILSSVLHGFLAASVLLFAAFPVSFAWSLHTDPLRKLVLGLVFALSVFTFSIGVEKLVLIVSPMGATSGNTADMLYKFSVLSLISGVEQNLVIIIGSTPKLSTLLKINPPSFSLLSKGVREKQDRETKGTPPTSSSFKSSPWPCDRSGSSDLETQPHLFRFDRVNQMETLVCRYSMASIEREPEGNTIRRTDKFVIVDNKPPISRGCI